MQKTAHSTLSDDGVLNLTCPRSWSEMTQQQLRYALELIGSGKLSSEEVRTLLLLHFTGMKVHRRNRDKWLCSVTVNDNNGERQRLHCFYIEAWQVQDMIRQLEYIDSYETMDVRLESIQGFKAVDILLHHVRFDDYLNMEKYYQGYLETRDKKYVLGLARKLYPGDVTEIDDAELAGCIMWYSFVKHKFAKQFPNFFKPVSEVGSRRANWLEQMNAQVRALTEGDITKEQAVFSQDCWRALTELDAKAHEAWEFRKKYPQK